MSSLIGETIMMKTTEWLVRWQAVIESGGHAYVLRRTTGMEEPTEAKYQLSASAKSSLSFLSPFAGIVLCKPESASHFHTPGPPSLAN